MDTTALRPSPPSGRGKGQLREGLAYVRRTPELLVPLLMMALVGCLAYEFQVTLPVLAITTLHGNASTYGFLTAAMGVGAVFGGLWTAGRGRTGMLAMTINAAVFAVVIALAAAAPNLSLARVAMLFVGAASVSFLSIGNSTLQLQAAPSMRGRVMALWAVAFLGSTPIGGPVAGFVAQHLGGRAGLGLGAVACALAALGGGLVMRRLRATRAADAAPIDPDAAAADLAVDGPALARR
jgi:MFS family permease